MKQKQQPVALKILLKILYCEEVAERENIWMTIKFIHCFLSINLRAFESYNKVHPWTLSIITVISLRGKLGYRDIFSVSSL